MKSAVDFAIICWEEILIALLFLVAVAVVGLLLVTAAKYHDVRPEPYKVKFVTLDDDGREGSQIIDLSPQFVVTGLEGEKWIIDPRDGHARLYDPAPLPTMDLPERGPAPKRSER